LGRRRGATPATAGKVAMPVQDAEEDDLLDYRRTDTLLPNPVVAIDGFAALLITGFEDTVGAHWLERNRDCGGGCG